MGLATLPTGVKLEDAEVRSVASNQSEMEFSSLHDVVSDRSCLSLLLPGNCAGCLPLSQVTVGRSILPLYGAASGLVTLGVYMEGTAPHLQRL